MKREQLITTIATAIATIIAACIELFTTKDTPTQEQDPETGNDSPQSTPDTNSKIIAGYYPNWIQPAPKLSQISTNYNLLYIFHAVPDGLGGVRFDPPYEGFFFDIQVTRKQGTKVLLTVGGANAGFQLTTRQQSTLFLESLKSLLSLLGQLDGIDFNNFEGGIVPNATEMIYIAKQLKNTYGQQFMITCPPAPWREEDLYMCKQLADNNLLDYAAPQWYDGPGLTQESNILYQLNNWVSALGQKKVVLGLGIAPGANYMTIEQAQSTVTKVLSLYPDIRGAFQWQAINDANNQYQFANTMKSLFK